MADEQSKKSPSENFAEMMKDFGSAMAEIFNDPQLKEKAKEFGESAATSAKTFASRFKDEDVKKKFKDLGAASKKFGESIADYFKDDTKKSENSSNAETHSEEPSAEQDSDKEQEAQEDGQPAQSGPMAFQEKQDVAALAAVSAEPAIKRFERDRNARITGYCFAIAWSIILVVFFNFFSRYIAYYLFDSASETWIITPVTTGSFAVWLPFINASLLAAVAGNVILIINDSFYFDNITNIVMHLFGITAAASLLVLFPFDFTIMSTSILSAILVPIIRIVLIVIIVGLSIGVLVRSIKIIVRAARVA